MTKKPRHKRKALVLAASRHDSPAATVTELAALEFGRVSDIASVTQEQRVEFLRAGATRVYQMAVLAAGFLAMDKAEAVKKVADQYDIFGPALMNFACAGNDARILLDLIKSAEVRLAVALAVVEGAGEDDADDPGAA